MHAQRTKKLQTQLKNPLLIKKKESLFYLTGHVSDPRVDEYLLVTKKDIVAFGWGLEKIDFAKKVDRLKNISAYLPKKSKLDIEYGFTYGEGEYLKHKLKESRVKVGPARSKADVIRQVKEPGELALVKKSMGIVEKVFGEVRIRLAKKTWTEIGLAKFIENRGKELGAEDVSFPTIVASGANAAIPHHVPGAKKLVTGESIIIDFGFKYKNYCSDFTRTVFLKFAPPKLADAYNQTEKAYNESMFTGKPGIKAEALYNKAVKVLADKKLEKYFIHSLGHGTGLEIHELPNLSPKSKDVLENSMVFSIEPGVYFPKLGGIRIEDLVYMEKGVVKKFINVSTNLKNNIL